MFFDIPFFDDNTEVFGPIENTAEKYNIHCHDESIDKEIQTKIIDVPSPFEGSFRIDDFVESSRYLLLEFEGIHDTYYMGINSVEFFDSNGESIDYKNIAVDGKEVDGKTVEQAMPVNGWWAQAGESHSLLFDFEKVTHVKEVKVWCANASATPKNIFVSNGKERAAIDSESLKFHEDHFLQLSGSPGMEPNNLKFLCPPSLSSQDNVSSAMTCAEVVNTLNKKSTSTRGFDSFISECGHHFVFYQKGMRSLACNYYLGKGSHSSEYNARVTNLVNSVTKSTIGTIEKVEERAMTLTELLAVRAIILSSCVKDKWTSSQNENAGTQLLRPEDVTLYDLNELLIKPMNQKWKCSFKELFGSSPAIPTYYVSHYWGQSVLEFINCCEYHAMMHDLAPSEAKYWVCAYANKQDELGTSDLVNNSNPDDSSFLRAIDISRGVLLMLDSDANVYSRIWVDFELYKAIKSEEHELDIVSYHKRRAHLLANNPLPKEEPYQKNRREMSFPFEKLCSKGLDVSLEKGHASEQIDKVRILNSMIGSADLDDGYVLVCVENQDKKDEFDDSLTVFELCNQSLRCELALKMWSVALSMEGQTVNDFFGHDLVSIVQGDTKRDSILFNNFTSLEEVNDEEFDRIFSVVSSSKVSELVLNMTGCHSITNDAIKKYFSLPDTIKDLTLKLGFSSSLSNDCLKEYLIPKLPSTLTKLKLDLSSNKLYDGEWSPSRKNDLLDVLSKKLPTDLLELDLTLCLDEDQNGDGLLHLAQSLPKCTTKFNLLLRNWGGFQGSHFIDMIKFLPSFLENLSIKEYGGKFLDDEDKLQVGKEVLSNLKELKHFTLYTFDDGEAGYYKICSIENLEKLKELVEEESNKS